MATAAAAPTLMATTLTASEILAPEQVGSLLVAPALFASVAAQVSTVVHTASHVYRIPVITADASASWVAEGAEIVVSDPALAEIDIAPAKIAALSVISRELAQDSNPAAAQVVGDSLARDIARRLDQAFFGSMTAPAPPGLGSVSLITGIVTEASGTFVSLDPFAAAIAAAHVYGAEISAFVTSPAEALALSTLKETNISIRPLLGADPSTPALTTIYGRPLLTSPYVAAKTCWAIPKERVFLIVRDDSRIEIDQSVFFTSDRTAIKGTMRIGFGFPHPLSTIKITHA